LKDYKMSCFLVGEDSINYLTSFFISSSYKNDLLFSQINNTLEEAGFKIVFDDKTQNYPIAEKLAFEMFKLNFNAYTYRYKEYKNFQIEGIKDLENYKFNEIEIGINSNKNAIFQVLKSLHCFIYQCSEGDIIEDKLYKTLDRIASIISNNLISELPEYKKVDWK